MKPVNLISYFLNRIFKILKNSKLKNLKKCDELESTIKAYFAIELPVDFIVNHQIIAFYSATLSYSFFFACIKPKLLLVLVGYGNEAKIYAAKRKNIPVIEMQHGTLSPYHVGYNVPKGQTKNYFADYFFIC